MTLPDFRTGRVTGFRIVNGVRTDLLDATRFMALPNKKTMVDTVTPGFAQRIAKGDFVSSPMTSVSSQYSGRDYGFTARSSTTANYEQWNEEANVGLFYFGLPLPQTLTLSIPNMKQYVSTKAISGSNSSRLQGLVTLAQGRKTLRMLAHPLGSLSSLLAFVTQQRQAGHNLAVTMKNGSRTINGRKFAVPSYKNKYVGPGKVVGAPSSSITIKIGDAISGTVLANNLGLRPFMMDINSILHEIPGLHQEERHTSRAMLDAKEERTQTRVYTSGAYKFTAKETTQHSVTVRAMRMYRERFSVLADFGISVMDLPSAFWELLPYSFVLDYFLNIGDLLDSLKAQSITETVAACLTTKIETIVKREWIASELPAPWYFTKTLAGEDSLHVETKTRENGLIAPGLAYKPLSTVARPAVVQNLLGLITQQLVGLSKPTKSRTFY